MKKRHLTLIALFVAMALGGYAQSKKELANQVQALNERCANLESQIANYQNMLMTLQSAQLSQATEIKALQDSLVLLRKITVKPKPKAVTKTFEEMLDEYGYSEKEKEILTMINEFYKGDSWEEKYAYVMPSDKVKQWMQEQYPKRSGSSLNSNGGLSGWQFVGDVQAVGKVIEVAKSLTYDVPSYYIVNTKDGYKIDWEASFGVSLSKPNWSYIRNNKITTPYDMRFDVNRIDTYYKNKNYWDLGDLPGFMDLLVEKNASISRVFMENSKEGKWVPYILSMAYDPNLDCVVVKKIVKKGTYSYYDKDK